MLLVTMRILGHQKGVRTARPYCRNCCRNQSRAVLAGSDTHFSGMFGATAFVNQSTFRVTSPESRDGVIISISNGLPKSNKSWSPATKYFACAAMAQARKGSSLRSRLRCFPSSATSTRGLSIEARHPPQRCCTLQRGAEVRPRPLPIRQTPITPRHAILTPRQLRKTPARSAHGPENPADDGVRIEDDGDHAARPACLASRWLQAHPSACGRCVGANKRRWHHSRGRAISRRGEAAPALPWRRTSCRFAEDVQVVSTGPPQPEWVSHADQSPDTMPPERRSDAPGRSSNSGIPLSVLAHSWRR